MSRRLVQIPVEALSKGLYVSQLDRPWMGTPFLFQGFVVETDDEIQQLCSLCSNVYVEVSEAEEEMLAKRRPTSAAPSNSALSELSRKLDSRQHLVPAKDPSTLKSELVQAKAVYGEALVTINDLFERLRRGNGLDVSRVSSVVDSMVESVFRNRDALTWLARMKKKDDYLYNHSLSSSIWALALARHLGLDKTTMRSIGIGAMVLDVGKIHLSESLLRKTNALSNSEWTEVRSHVEAGMAMLERGGDADACVKDMVRLHHERMDGSGYPSGLSGDSIPLAARIAAVVDCYDAMTSERYHAKARSPYDAVKELNRLSKSWFPPELVEMFVQAVGVFPSGSLVELSNGEVGVVVSQNRFRRLRPKIMVILDSKKQVLDQFKEVDLQLYEQTAEGGDSSLWIARGLEPGAFGVDPMEYFL